MEDLIACLYPFDEGQNGYANRAVLLPQNLSRYIAPREQPPEPLGRHSRESTAPLDGTENNDTSGLAGNGL